MELLYPSSITNIWLRAWQWRQTALAVCLFPNHVGSGRQKLFMLSLGRHAWGGGCTVKKAAQMAWPFGLAQAGWLVDRGCLPARPDLLQ